MLLDTPMILHSRRADGRHWLTSFDVPPLQIWPVAPNHCRVGHFLAAVICAKLSQLDSEIPEYLTLSPTDVASVPDLAGRYPEMDPEPGPVCIRLIAQPGPRLEEEDQPDDDDDLAEFVTPQPPLDWSGDYDTWIATIARRLGLDAPQPCGEDGYEKAMSSAAASLQQRLDSLRERFIAGMEGHNLGFKIGLTTRKGGTEYVWVRATDWSQPGKLVAVLECQTRDCKGYKLGQTLQLSHAELLDYCIGSETAGVIEPGLTQRIAEDYGLVLP